MADEMMQVCALTTIDNPYNPFTQFDQWYTFDQDKGYCSCSYLDRIAHTSSQLSDEENQKEIIRAIKEIIRLDPFNIYRMVCAEDYRLPLIAQEN